MTLGRRTENSIDEEGAPVDVDAQLSKERSSETEITQLLAQAQADLKRVDGNGAYL